MKCPKCSYLGFETGDRCRNCGYDFSLILDSDQAPVEVDLDVRHDREDAGSVPDWTIRTDVAPAPPAQSASVRPGRAHALPQSARGPRGNAGASRDSRLPLFTAPSPDTGDEPLISLPVTPRAPLAVRRTPDSPRMRAMAGAVRPVERTPDRAPVLQFDETLRTVAQSEHPAPAPAAPLSPPPEKRPGVHADASGPAVRVGAALIDHVLLGAIDLAVVYFTLRIAALSMSEWTALPIVPLVVFLFVLKIAYFYAFTAVGGQTIGKMAFRIRVVGEDHGAIDATLALRRTLLGAASTAVLGLGLVPAFFDPDRRAFHDRLTRTRVVALPTA